MNRIILIGNGFDLAHGLKTSYADFIDWYWGEWGKRLRRGQGKLEQDGLCSFKLNDEVNVHSWAYVWGWHYQRRNPSVPWDNHDVVELAKQDSNLCSFSFTSPFFREVCLDVERKGWVDIENIYYSHLNSNDVDPVVLNNQLSIIREKLIEYLIEVQKDISEDMVKEELRIKMKLNFREKDIAYGSWGQFSLEDLFGKKKTTPEQILLLNFNYTTLADLYLPHSTRNSPNHIHGRLSNPNSVIFGYGDELDENYKNIVNKNDNEYLRNIKSVKYLESSNYRHLLEFIETTPYQIYIMGHSCGNSDRTLLNTLFEHRNCVSIKPFYHKRDDGSDNYMELVQNISRNFTDMKLMRDRVVNKTYCDTI